MAITRRQFVTRLSALAAAVGMSQVDLAKVTEAFAHGAPWTGGWTAKPKVIWVHGAECTGCSTAFLGLFENALAPALSSVGSPTTKSVLDKVGGQDIITGTADTHPYAHRIASNTGSGYYVGGGYGLGQPADTNSPNGPVGVDADVKANLADSGVAIVNVADVLIDFLDVQYHETVMGAGGDLAYKLLGDNVFLGSTSAYVLVVEGAVQDSGTNSESPAWPESGTSGAAWCSVGESGHPTVPPTGWDADLRFDTVVKELAKNSNCAAVIAIGQCASFGGYPACVSPVSGEKQTPAYGVRDFLIHETETVAAGKVINAPGCPTNPWWFVLTVVAWLADFVSVQGGTAYNIKTGPLGILTNDGAVKINSSAVDRTGRLKAIYGLPIHGPQCPRYQEYVDGNLANTPGEDGCLQMLGCKGPSTNSLCPTHGWNAQNPDCIDAWEYGVNQLTKNGAYENGHDGSITHVNSGSAVGTFCVAAGHPCMGCTEKGYPDAFVPFVVRV